MKFVRRFFGVLFTLLLTLGMLPADAAAVGPSLAPDATFVVEPVFTYDQTGAREMLEYVNGFRTGSGKGNDATHPHQALDFSGNWISLPCGKLKWSSDLEKIAMQRAAEIALHFEHQRPDGNTWSSVFTDGSVELVYTGKYGARGENITEGFSSAWEAFLDWRADDKPYEGQGYRVNMLKNDYTEIGVSHVTYRGRDFWVQILGKRSSSSDNIPEIPVFNGEKPVKITIRNDRLIHGEAGSPSEPKLTYDNSPLDMLINTSHAEPESPRLQCFLNNTKPGPTESGAQPLDLPIAGVSEWTIADSTILARENGRLVAKAPGETKLTMSLLGETLTIPVTVTCKHRTQNGWQHNNGNHWKVCDVCGNHFDEAAHVWDKTSYQHNGSKHWKVCSVCKNPFDEAAHVWGETGYRWSNNPVGCTAVRCCQDCGLEETDAGTISSEITSQPTCGHPGTTTYTAVFTKPWAQTQKAQDELTPSQLPHNWGEITCEWAADNSSCTAKRICRNDASHVETAVSTQIQSSVTQVPTCETPGKTNLTAVFNVDWAAAQTKEVNLPAALGHDWGETVYSWADDGSTCTAAHTCKRDPNHKENISAAVTSKVGTAPTCTAGGSTLYTAAFSESWAAAQTKEITNLAALGHQLVEQPKTDPTCTQAGYEQHWKCSRCGLRFSDAQGSIPLDAAQTMPALGHTFEDVWKKDDTGHWHVCTVCGARADEDAHSFEWVVDVPPQDGKPGRHHQECTVCHHKLPEEEIPAYTAGGDDHWQQDTDQGLGFTASSPIKGAAVGGETLKADDMVLDGKNLTLKTEYLEMLKPETSYTLTLEFEHGSLDMNFVTGPYAVTEGDGSSFSPDTSTQSLSFHANGAFRKFESVYVDGKLVDKKNYTAEEGATIIKLTPAYLETLTPGEHAMTIQYTDGACGASFTLQERVLPPLPETGDDSHLLLLMACCGFAAVTAVLIKKYKKN